MQAFPQEEVGWEESLVVEGGLAEGDRLVAAGSLVEGGSRLAAVVEGRPQEEGFAVAGCLAPFRGACLGEFGPFGSCWPLVACAAGDLRPGQRNVVAGGRVECFAQVVEQSHRQRRCPDANRIPDRTCCRLESIHHKHRSSTRPPPVNGGDATLPKGLLRDAPTQSEENTQEAVSESNSTHILMQGARVRPTEGRRCRSW